MIDVGAWFGGFLKIASERGWQVGGIEPNRVANLYLMEKFGKNFFSLTNQEFLDSYAEGKADVVTIFHVIEHITEGRKFIEEIRRINTVDGYLFLRTPNIESFIYKIFKNNWGHLAIPIHVNIYSESSIKMLLSKSGYEIISIKTISSPAVNEIFEVVKCILKILKLKDLIQHLSSSNIKFQKNKFSKNVGLMANKKAYLEKITYPFYILTCPIWYFLNWIGMGSEIVVVARKKNE